jgi:NAD(P)-dependent dehydrogenase (short-subunit alcohol dehydrogenase family)
MKDFAGRVAVVTGGGTGMGRELVRQLVAEGCNVAMCDVFAHTMAETKRLCEAVRLPQGLRITTHIADVSDEAQVQRFRDEVAEHHDTDKIHLLFNNAGIGGGGSMIASARDEWEKTFDVCWGGVYYNTRAFLPMLRPTYSKRPCPSIVWNRAVSSGVDRLAINPDGQLLYVPTWEGGSADYINILDANTGDVVRKVHFSNRSHDTQYPLSGPIFQETKANDGSGSYLYLIDPGSYTVSRVGPYSGILGPYVVDSTSTYAINNVTNLWGMQVANLKTGQIITAGIPEHPPGDAGLLHGIGWAPDQTEVWQNSTGSDPHVYIWDMLNPMAPLFKQTLTLRSGRGSHWLTFDIKGDYGYVAPNKNSTDGTEIFNARTHTSVGVIRSSEDMLEIDFADGKISQVGDQYGIGRR